MTQKITLGGDAGAICIPRDNFILLHDFIAEVLNTSRMLSKASKDVGEELTMEECAGRVLVVTISEMNSYVEKNPDFIEELMVAESLKEKKPGVDTMYG